MDQDNSPIKQDPDSNSVQRDGEEMHPVAWTPEDASRFLSNAIHEAQKPLADALKSRPITTPVLVLILALLVLASAAIGWILSNQLNKTERAAEQARASRDEAMVLQHQLQTKSDTLEMRLAAAREEQERLSQEFMTESESLRGQVEGKRDNEEELRRAQYELARYRRQNELLRTQISGLEMEKQALSRQLDAVKAMAIGDEDDFAAPPEPPTAPGAMQSPPEPPTAEAPKLDRAGRVPSPSTAARSGFRVTGSPPETDTVTVEAIENGGTETGTLSVGPDGDNPPTLYESARLTDEDIRPPAQTASGDDAESDVQVDQEPVEEIESSAIENETTAVEDSEMDPAAATGEDTSSSVMPTPEAETSEPTAEPETAVTDDTVEATAESETEAQPEAVRERQSEPADTGEATEVVAD